MTIYPVRTLGVREVKDGPREWRGITISRLSAFRITPLGRQLLRII
ncbi:MAG: hypothetical protein JXB30_13355 [Anaerolineae bacterium]|nr:hypothetical protein [Anaerolineae bacterium]